jgi:hypothetical protein
VNEKYVESFSFLFIILEFTVHERLPFPLVRYDFEFFPGSMLLKKGFSICKVHYIKVLYTI